MSAVEQCLPYIAAQLLTLARTVCTRLVQAQVSQSSRLDGGGAHEVPPLAEELLASDGCWGREASCLWVCGL